MKVGQRQSDLEKNRLSGLATITKLVSDLALGREFEHRGQKVITPPPLRRRYDDREIDAVLQRRISPVSIDRVSLPVAKKVTELSYNSPAGCETASIKSRLYRRDSFEIRRRFQSGTFTRTPPVVGEEFSKVRRRSSPYGRISFPLNASCVLML